MGHRSRRGAADDDAGRAERALSTREDLEARLAEHPDDAALFQVYGDLLQELRDPLAWLMQREGTADAKLRKRVLPAPLRAPNRETWRHGFLRSFDFELRALEELDEIGAALDSLPGRFIHDVGFVGAWLLDPAIVQPLQRLLASRPRITGVTLRGEPYAAGAPAGAMPLWAVAALPGHLTSLTLDIGHLYDGLDLLGASHDLRQLKHLKIHNARLRDSDVLALRTRAGRVARGCTLTLPVRGAAFRFDRVLSRDWPVRMVEDPEGPALLATRPMHHAGLGLGLRHALPDSPLFIGAEAGSALDLDGSGLRPFHALIDTSEDGPHVFGAELPTEIELNGKVLTDDGARLQHGDELTMGSVTLRYLTHGYVDAWKAERDAWQIRVPEV